MSKIGKDDIEKCIKSGMSNTEIFRHFNISKSTLLRLCKNFGLSLDRRASPEVLGSLTSEKFKEFLDKGYTLDDAAEESGVSRSFLAKKASELNISFSKNKFNLEEYLKLKNMGMLDKDIAAKFGMTPHGLYERKVYHNLKIEDKNFNIIQKEKLEDLYINKRVPIKNISEKLDKGVTSIYELLKKYKTPLRKEEGLTINKEMLLFYVKEKKSISELAELFRTTEKAIKLILIRYGLDEGNLYSEEGDLMNIFSDIQEQLIYGSLMGDSGVGFSHSNCNLKIAHGEEQKDYVLYKASILKNFVQKNGTHERIIDSPRYDRILKGYWFNTIQSRLFSDLYPLFYNPKKYVNQKVLDKLNGQGLAFWFMDDGYKYNKYGLALCTECYSLEDTQKIKKYFLEKWKIICYISKDNRIIFNQKEAIYFQNIIKPYILPYFYYKLLDSSAEFQAKIKELRINEKDWKNLDSQDLEKLVDKIFLFYREIGFPYYSKSKIEKMKSFRSIENFDYSSFLNNKELKQVTHGLSLAWSYFPHSWEIPCNSNKTALEVFYDDDLFKKCIRKRLKRGTYITHSGIRKAIRSFSGTQVVSNFRPTVAKYIYDNFLPEEGVALDMSAGFGGRLLGALASKKLKKYIGLEPSLQTFKGLLDLSNDFSFAGKEICIHNVGSEDFISSDKVDLCFTSPPYFKTEKYSVEETQSYIKFPTRELWLHGFLEKTLDNCWLSLKDEGYLIINIADVRCYSNLVEDFLNVASKRFVLLDTYRLLLSSLNTGGYKSEPLFIFKKRIIN